jgi:Leucine-rich repeat (LRR) protein
MFPIKGVGLDNETLLHTWISRYKYLRYLYLDYSSFETLPNSIAELEHLRVLSLSYNKKIKRLPHSIFKLHNLQLLALNGCTELETLPKGLGKMTSLRHLNITTKQSVLTLTEFVNLNHLQYLAFEDCENMKFEFSGEEQFTSIKTLQLLSCGSLESLPLYIFPKLLSLRVEACKMLNLSLNNEGPVKKLMMKHLFIINIPGLLTLPGWVEGAAETLHTLIISNLPNLHTLPECLTTMTHLKRLIIADCPQLLSLPSGIHHLPALEQLVIKKCPKFLRYEPLFGKSMPMMDELEPIEEEEEE